MELFKKDPAQAAEQAQDLASFDNAGTKQDRVRKILLYLLWNFILLGVMALLDYIAAELAMHTGCAFLSLGKDFGKFKIFYNVLLYGLVEMLFFAVFANFRAAIAGGALFTCVFAAINIYLYEFTSIPLYVTDLTNVGTAAGVVNNYKLTLLPGIRVLLVFLVLVIVLLILLGRTRRPYFKQQKWYVRWGIRLLCTLLVVGAGWKVVSHIVNSRSMKRISISTYRPIKSYRANGGLLTFVRSGKLLKIDVPEGYSKETVEALGADYPSDTARAAGYNQPNVIVIMDEAFADLQQVGTFETNEEVIPFFNSLTENTVRGRLYVSVFGGHTSNTEYEFLSGDSIAFLPSGTTAYQVYIKDMFPGLTKDLMLDGYQGLLAMHPYVGTGYNRARVYPYMYFERFITQDDFNDPAVIRNYVSDEADFNRIISEYEDAKAASDAPFYMFNVTMQNHSGYGMSYNNLDEVIKITTPGLSDPEAERYLNLIHLSDAAFKNLITYFEGVDDPTVIVMFGDHEPGLSDAFYESIMGKTRDEMSREELMDLYWTPFVIWANYDIEERADVRTSVNYLQTVMQEAAGMKMSGYNKFLAAQMEQIPVFTNIGYWGENGEFYKDSDKESPYYEQVERYHTLCYNHLFDPKNRWSGFELQAQ